MRCRATVRVSRVQVAAGLIALLIVSAMATAPARAQISFPGAAPISAGNVTVYLKPQSFDYTDGVRSTVDRNVLIYGASPNLAFILQNNTFVANAATVATKNGPQQITANGFGDTLLEARYTVYQQDGPGSTFRIAPYFGTSMPTGMDNVNGLMPRAGQPGTGAWATRDAVTMSYQTLDWNAAAETGYQANSDAAGYRFGNTYYADAAFRYRLWPTSLETVVPAEVYGFVESNYTSMTANRASGAKVTGTGGQLWLLDPGIIYTARVYSLTLMGFLPAFQQVRNNGSRVNYGLLAMFRYSLFTPYHW
jgi:hypothetical protein